ncbi:MAG: hypothetical protein WC523_02675 [Patescibacteria group bacterium]
MFKIINIYFRSRWERFYLKNRWHLILDLSLITILIILGISAVSLYYYRPTLNWSWSETANLSIDFNNPPLKLELQVATSSLQMAEGIILKINYQNDSPTIINQAVIKLMTSDQNYLIGRLEKIGINPEIEIKDQEIIFSALKGGISGEALVRVYFTANNPLERQISWRAKSAYSLGGQLFTETWDLPVLKIFSELSVKVAAYYTSPQGDQLGVGPLPPVLGLPTNYWIFVEAKNQGDFKDFVFSARLPKGVELMSNRSLLAGDFKYATSSRQVIWKIGEIKNQETNYRLSFEIQLTPTKEQLGLTPNLLITPLYYAQDLITDTELSGELNNLTTNLDSDRFNKGQGRVSE